MTQKIEKQVLGTWLKAQMALNQGEHEEAIHLFNQITDEHPDAQRYLALAHFDNDEIDDAITEFEIAYNMGDLKALPWLSYLIQESQPEHPKADFLQSEVERLTDSNDADVLLSVANIEMLFGDTERALELWSRAGTSSWLAVMNLLPHITEDLDEKIHYILDGKPKPADEEAMNEVIIALLWKFVDNGVTEAAVTLAQFLASQSEERVTQEFEKLFPVLWSAIQEGEPYALDIYLMGLLHELVEGDIDALHREFAAYGLEEYESQLIADYQESVDSNAQPSTPLNPIRTNIAGGWDKDQYYTAAQEAEAQGDQFAELSAWRSLEDLGDTNGLHNFAISVGKEIDLSVSFMSVDGATDHAWAPFVAGILQEDMRPGRDIAELDEIPAPTPTSQSSFFARVKESLDYNFIKYTEVDENYLAIPYSHETGIQSIFLHCALLDGLETCILTTTLGVNEISRAENLSPSQKRALKAIFRNAELVFPNTMIDIGDVFNPIAPDLKPSPFAVNYDAQTLAYGRFFEFSDFVPAIDPLRDATQTLVVGYGITSELTGPHLDVALQSSCQVLIEVFNTFANMHDAAEEVLGILFPHTPLQMGTADLLIDKDAITSNPTQLSDFLTILMDFDDDSQAQPHIEKGAALGIGALQVIAASIAVRDEDLAKASKWADTALAAGVDSSFIGDTLNNLGWGYLLQGDEETGIKYLRHSAAAGCANAMSTVTWHLLQEGKHQEARVFFDAHYFTIMTSLDSDEDFDQASNMRSNDALNRWALGASDDEVIAIWSDEKFQEGHSESLFYPLLAQWRRGNKEIATAALTQLPESVLTELRQTFSSSDKRVGWFAELTADAAEFLGASKPKKKGFFSRS
jgi:tetratricopeptide (TPR) repeat protein